MLKSIVLRLIDQILGAAGRAGQQLLDAEAKLALPPRALGNGPVRPETLDHLDQTSTLAR